MPKALAELLTAWVKNISLLPFKGAQNQFNNSFEFDLN